MKHERTRTLAFNAMQELGGLRSTQDVLDDPETIPECSGVYFIFGDTSELLAGTGYDQMEDRDPFTVGGTDLLYIGASRNLRARISCHLKDDSSASTFRMSMGCLLKEDLDLTIFSQATRPTFAFGQGEARLTRWLCLNTAIAVWPCRDALDLEKALIKSLPAPLNITNRRQHPYARYLVQKRSEAAGRAGRPRRRPVWIAHRKRQPSNGSAN